MFYQDSLNPCLWSGRMPERRKATFIGNGTNIVVQSKKSFASVNYAKCNPKIGNPEKGLCVAALACTHKVITQIDGAYEQPMIFQDMCMGCWDCVEACPLESIFARHVT